jgi:hypothetical protein
MKTALNPLHLSLAILVGLSAPALGQVVNNFGLIDLSKTPPAVTVFSVATCNSPQAVTWGPAAGAAKCVCDDDDDKEHDGDKRDGHARRGHGQRGEHHGEHDDGDHDDGDRCECDHDDKDHHDSGRHADHDGRHHDDDEDDDDDCAPPPAATASNVAYAACEQSKTFVRMDFGTPPGPVPPGPTVTTQPLVYAAQPSSVSIDPTGTHALVCGSNMISYLDLTKTTAAVPPAAALPFQESGIAVTSAFPVDAVFYGSAKALILDEAGNSLYVVDLPTTPAPGTLQTFACNAADTHCKKIQLLSEPTAVAVDTARNRAVVTLAAGGVQAVDLVGGTVSGPVGEPGETLGVAIAPAGTPAIAVYENEFTGGGLTGGFAIVVSLPVSSPPATPGKVDLRTPPNKLEAASAVDFNPVTLDALIVGDDGVAIVKPPYSAVSTTIRYPVAANGIPLMCGTTKHGISANADGIRALVVNEDLFCHAPITPFAPVAPVLAATVAPKHSDRDDDHHDKCEKRRKHHDD